VAHPLLRSRHIALIGVGAIVVALWAWFAVHRAIPFWQQAEDYAWYALSQAFTIESRVAGVPAQNGGFLVHPGVPYALASWLSLRISALDGSSADRVMSTLQDPEGFWMAAKSLALALNFAGVLAYRFLLRSGALLGVACLAYLAFLPAVLGSSLLELTVESFALPFIVASYALAFHFFKGMGGGREPSVIVACGLGCLAAIGLSLKIYYLAPTVGVGVALAWAAITRSLPVAGLVRIVLSAGASFAVVAYALIIGTIGTSGAQLWLQWNLAMLGHSGRYGSGQSGFMDVSTAAGNLQAMVEASAGTFLLVILLLATVIAAGSARQTPAGSRPGGRRLFVIAVVVGASLNLVGVLKHFSPHYAVPLCAMLPCLLAIVDSSRLSKRFLVVALGAAAALFTMNVGNYAATHERRLSAAYEVQADIARIESMPLAAGPRVWGYLSAAPSGIAPLLISYSGSEWIARTARQVLGEHDTIPRNLITSAKWGLVILPKTYFQDRASLDRVVKGQFDFMETDFRLCPADSITELKQFFVVTPAPRAADGSCGPGQK
jgi:hypothetical protein